MITLSEIWKAIRHNQATIVALVIVLGITVWIYGCQSTVTSPVSEKKVTRGQLVAEADKFAADLSLAYEDLDRQDAFKQQIVSIGVAYAETGGINPIGAGLSLLGIVSAGLLVDNRRKDVAIKSKTNALEAVKPTVV